MDDRDTVVAGGGGGGGAVDAGERVVVLAKMALGLVTAAKERNKNSFVTLVRELKPVLFAWKGAVRDQVLRDPGSLCFFSLFVMVGSPVMIRVSSVLRRGGKGSDSATGLL